MSPDTFPERPPEGNPIPIGELPPPPTEAQYPAVPPSIDETTTEDGPSNRERIIGHAVTYGTVAVQGIWRAMKFSRDVAKYADNAIDASVKLAAVGAVRGSVIAGKGAAKGIHAGGKGAVKLSKWAYRKSGDALGSAKDWAGDRRSGVRGWRADRARKRIERMDRKDEFYRGLGEVATAYINNSSDFAGPRVAATSRREKLAESFVERRLDRLARKRARTRSVNKAFQGSGGQNYGIRVAARQYGRRRELSQQRKRGEISRQAMHQGKAEVNATRSDSYVRGKSQRGAVRRELIEQPFVYSTKVVTRDSPTGPVRKWRRSRARKIAARAPSP